ncbi:transporter substrate-binding domain-containing protein [Rhodanobacter lindaniclasticus]
MRKHLWPLCLLFTLALVPGATTRAAGQTIKVYPIAAGTAATVAPATELQHANQPLLVGVAVAPPFVIEDHGHYRGLAIELWEAVAADHGWKYVYQPYALDGLLDAVRDSKVDVGLGAITATAAGAQHTDFSHPILSTGLGVAVRGGQTAGWLAVARALESPVFLTVATALVLLLLVAGSLLWLLEYRRRPEPSDSGRGLFSGIWWATATLTTVGGDAAPRTVGGRIVGLVWMLVALAIVAGLTATITSALTVGQLGERVRHAADLADMPLASVPASAGAAWLQQQRLDYRQARDVDAALDDLAAGGVDAVVLDQPLLRWDIRQRYRGQLKVLPLLLQRQDYAFALPAGSRLRQPIDVSLLKQINAPDWPQRLDRAFGGGGP